MIEPKDLSPIGIGTFRTENDTEDRIANAINHSIDCGQNFMSTGFSYANGAVCEKLGQAFKQINRDSLFLYCYAESDIQSRQDIVLQLEKYLKTFSTDFIDCFQVHVPIDMKLPLDDIYEGILRLIDSGKVRYLAVGNLGYDKLKDFCSNFKPISFEGLYNLECRQYEKAGVTEFCRDNGIRFHCYQPLRRNKTQAANYPLLCELSEKYGYSQNQIILNWILKEKQLNTMIKSLSFENIDSNLKALDFSMDSSDYEKLNAFECIKSDSIKVAWDKGDEGIPIHMLANKF